MSEPLIGTSPEPQLTKGRARTALLPRLSGALFPVGTDRAGPRRLAAIFLLGSVAVFFRLGNVAVRGNLWAEDGNVFLQTALLHKGIASVFEPYGGYMNLAPRMLAMLVAPLPIASQGMAVNLAAAMAQAGVATLAYVATSGFIRRRLWRLLLSLAVIAVPVGSEVIDSIANVQWFLLFGGCICLLWTPRRPVGWGVLFVVMLSATLSTPFAVVLLAGALFRLAVQRSRAATALVGVVATGFVIQSLVMLQAPPRTGRNEIGVDLSPGRLVAGFVRRVLGDGVLGVAHHPTHLPAPGLLAGAAVVILLAILVICLTTHDGFPVLLRAGVLGVLAILTYSMPVVATPPLSTEEPFAGGRYYVAPVLLTIVAIISMMEVVTGHSGRPKIRIRWLAVAVRGALVLALLWGLGSSWSAGRVWGRPQGPSWQPGVEQARKACELPSSKGNAAVPISPPGWSMTVPCKELVE